MKVAPESSTAPSTSSARPALYHRSECASPAQRASTRTTARLASTPRSASPETIDIAHGSTGTCTTGAVSTVSPCCSTTRGARRSRTANAPDTLERPPTTTTPPDTSQLAAPQSAPTTASGWVRGMRDAVPPARSMLTSAGTRDVTTTRAGCSTVSSCDRRRPVASNVTTSAPSRAPAGSHEMFAAVGSAGRPRPTDTPHFSPVASVCGCTQRSTPDRSPACQRTTTPLRPRPRSSTRASSTNSEVPAGSIAGARPVGTRVRVAVVVPHAPRFGATLSSTDLPIASSAAGGRTAAPPCSMVQSPDVPGHATRPSVSKRALPPTGACQVSARAEIETSSSRATTWAKTANRKRMGPYWICGMVATTLD